MTALRSLEGQTALVTGGASGLGAAICRSLAQAACKVAVIDMQAAAAQRTAEDLRSHGARAAAYPLDVADESRAELVIDNIERELGPVDTLVNCAGVDVTLPLEELSLGAWDRVIRTNLRGPLVLSKLVVPRMRKRGGGAIVNIASTAAKRTWPNAAAYHASKWGLLGLSHALHAELRPAGIRVTAIVAGGMRTPFLLERFPELDPQRLQDPAVVAETVRFILTLPAETVVPEMTVLPRHETSWP